MKLKVQLEHPYRRYVLYFLLDAFNECFPFCDLRGLAASLAFLFKCYLFFNWYLITDYHSRSCLRIMTLCNMKVVFTQNWFALWRTACSLGIYSVGFTMLPYIFAVSLAFLLSTVLISHENGCQKTCWWSIRFHFCGSIDPAYGLRDPYHVDSFSEPQVSTCQGPEENKFLNEAAEKAGGLNDHIYSFSEPQTSSFRIPKDKKASSQSKNGKASPSISEEWEKLIIIDDLTDDFATTAAPRPAAAKLQRAKSLSPVKQLDEKTSRILERLEAPKAKKLRANTGKVSTSGMLAPSRVAGTQTRKRCCHLSLAQGSLWNLPSTS